MKRLRALLPILFFLLGSATASSAQNEDDPISVSILTCAVGPELYSIFGHNAIRIVNHETGEDVVYDYGVFDFEEPNFLLKFINGKLKYRLEKRPYVDFLHAYQMEGRGVVEDVLHLSTSGKTEVQKLLKENLKPENRFYYYDFFHDNCATRLRDLLEKTDEAGYIGTDREGTATFRSGLHKYMEHRPWVKFGSDIILGQPADRTMSFREEMFLPEIFSRNLKKYSLQNGNALVGATFDILPNSSVVYSKKVAVSPSVVLYGALAALLLTLIVLPNIAFAIGSIIQLFLGTIGLFLVYLWLFSTHEPFQYNWNLLWLNPLYLGVFSSRLKRLILPVVIAMNGLCLVFWAMIPQDLNELAIPVIAGMIIISFLKICKRKEIPLLPHFFRERICANFIER